VVEFEKHEDVKKEDEPIELEASSNQDEDSRDIDLAINYRTIDLSKASYIDEEKRYTPEDDSLSSYDNFFDYVNNYGLCFDYVSPNTFEDQNVGYFRYQVCYGGPTQEFRIFTDYDKNIDRIEFWYLDWFDGAKVVTDDEIIEDVISQFLELSQIEPSEEDHE